MIGARRDPARAAVVFVHGAGYLQNVHRQWSTYSREYMFHQPSGGAATSCSTSTTVHSGYGRDWRTAIYRHMGGKDLDDQVDAAKWVIAEQNVNPKRIGIYGGSYGGFITLMAMFTTPDVFAAGAALRPVTDWAHYNHGYTSNILNTPQKDAEAYRTLLAHLLRRGSQRRAAHLPRHGRHQRHFQDTVRLAQRLIELRKENWELAASTRSRTTRFVRPDQLGGRIQAHPQTVRGQSAREWAAGDELVTADAVLALFRQSGALLEGHFKLSSGLHSNRYLQSALVLQHPEQAAQLGRAIAESVRSLKPNVVLSPALGGIVIGQETARALGVRAIFAERADGRLTLRRGFQLSAEDRAVVVETSSRPAARRSKRWR